MDAKKVGTFMELAGQKTQAQLSPGEPQMRALGAQLLLSEVLEYIIRGLGVVPNINGTPVTDPESIEYKPINAPHAVEMVDGLADVAYTMYWNACCFGVPLERAFELVCENNLEKFVRLPNWTGSGRLLEKQEWDCGANISWPAEVTRVEVLKVGDAFFAVGKDGRGKVRKPSSYRPVDLSELVE